MTHHAQSTETSHNATNTNRKQTRRITKQGTARLSVGTLEDAQRKVDAWFEGVTRETVVDDIAKLVDEGAENGLIKIADDSKKLEIAIAARVFFDKYLKKIITLSDGRHVYFTPDERNLDRGLSKSESWATYCIHAVTHGGARIKGKNFNERIWSPQKAENMIRIENIIQNEICYARLDHNDSSRDRVIFIGESLNGERIDVVTKLDEFGNVDADLTEITAVMTGGKMPPLDNEPLTEAVKKVVIHQADGYSPLTDSTIAHPGGNVNGGSRLSVALSSEARAQAQREYDAVVAQYKGTDACLKAHNGKPTNLTNLLTY